jgi:hypothetical protein
VDVATRSDESMWKDEVARMSILTPRATNSQREQIHAANELIVRSRVTAGSTEFTACRPVRSTSVHVLTASSVLLVACQCMVVTVGCGADDADGR